VTPATSISPPPPTPGTLSNNSGALANGNLPGGGLTVPPAVAAAERQGINTNTLTPVQKQVLSALSLAKVKTVVTEQGFLVLDGGTKKGLRKGQNYQVRRDGGVICRIRISDAVEEEEAVADMELSSIPTGVTVQPGDEIISPVGQ
jgi:hypothetical protein